VLHGAGVRMVIPREPVPNIHSSPNGTTIRQTDLSASRWCGAVKPMLKGSLATYIEKRLHATHAADKNASVNATIWFCNRIDAKAGPYGSARAEYSLGQTHQGESG
jgi:hypothetical protein